MLECGCVRHPLVGPGLRATCNRNYDFSNDMTTKTLYFGPHLAPHPDWPRPHGMFMVPNDGQQWTEAMWTAHTRMIDEGLKLQREVWVANREIHCEIEGLPEVSSIYQTLFHRTRTFTTTLRDLVGAMAVLVPQQWAQTACLAVDWSIHILRNENVGFERFLHSQRESIYWMLDDTLLHILVDQWDDTSSKIPWDKSTEPIRTALAQAEGLIPEWANQDLEEMRKWKDYINAPLEVLEEGYFRRSRKFLHQSTRIYEVWRTMRLFGNGQLPAELANAIVEDVFSSEDLPMENLRTLYFPKGKGKETTS